MGKRGSAAVVVAVLGVALAGAARGADATPASGSASGSGSGSASPSGSGSVAPPVLEDIEQMCALLTSCDSLPFPPQVLPRDFAACVRAMGDALAGAGAPAFSLAIRECGLRANTCAELRTCALRGAKPDACAGRGADAVAGYCDVDGRALSCFHDKVLAVRDCPRGGEQCAVRGGEALCALGPCPPEMKDGAPPVCSASGTRILRCERGRLVSLDCAAFGLACVTANGAPGCATRGAPCAGDADVTRCEGSVAVGCHHGREVKIDCAAAGLACAAGDRGARAVGACVAPAPDGGAPCDPAAPARCAGASVAYCAAGRPRTFLCKSMSFDRCVSDARGARCGS